MAKIVITIEDEDDGTINLKCESEPPFKMKEPELNSNAQVIALEMVNLSLDEIVHSVTVTE